MTSLAESSKTLYVVHGVDTEGPLDETLDATFERLEQIYGISLEPSEGNLVLLQNQTFPGITGQLGASIAETFSPANLRFNRSWEQIDQMNERVFSKDFRTEQLDSFGQPWKISWFCMDHVNLKTNPRRKTQGYGAIHRYYNNWVNRFPEYGDELQFHFHPRSIQENDVAAATGYSSNLPEIIEVLARRLLEFSWFPTVYRPGFHSIRPDSNLFLEQWFPFDYSNQHHLEDSSAPDLSSGRFGDWRAAPSTWRGYHPSIDDYQQAGSLARTTFRCLNMGTRVRLLRQEHVEEAFAEADEKGASILAFTDHDFRDITPDISQVRKWLTEVGNSYGSVSIRYASASEAARSLQDLPSAEPSLAAHISGNQLYVETNRAEIFSHQPFLAIELRDGAVVHDNFDRGAEPGHFRYTFDDLTAPLSAVKRIGVAVSGVNGKSSCQVFTPESG